MTIPSAMFIEMGVALLQECPAPTQERILAELHQTVGTTASEFEKGYLLGVAAADALGRMKGTIR